MKPDFIPESQRPPKLSALLSDGPEPPPGWHRMSRERVLRLAALDFHTHPPEVEAGLADGWGSR